MKKNAAHTDKVLSFKKAHTITILLSFSNSSPAPPKFPFLAVRRYLILKRNSHKLHFLLLFGSFLSFPFPELFLYLSMIYNYVHTTRGLFVLYPALQCVILRDECGCVVDVDDEIV